ncbi:MAG: hypothetical protein ACM3PY_16790 [Omnitrophica WOR_2 bacterium]
MSANASSTSTSSPAVPVILGIMALLFVVAVLSGKQIPLVNSERVSVVALALIGMAICSQAGIGRVSATGAWAHPLSILGYLLGAVILIIAGAALINRLIPPMISYRQAFMVITGIALFKVVISFIHRLL